MRKKNFCSEKIHAARKIQNGYSPKSPYLCTRIHEITEFLKNNNIGIGVLIIFQLWDIQPIRSTLKKMPAWNFVGRKMKKNLA